MARPRPVAGLPGADPRSVARAWLVRRIEAAPLEAATGLAGGAWAERAPALCGSLLAALADDAALEALLGEGALLAALALPAGAGAAPAEPVPGAAVELAVATEHLRAATASELIARTDIALHATLQDRLAHACARLLEGALAAPQTIRVHDTRAPSEVSALLDPRGRLTAEAERLVVAQLPFALLAVEVEDAAVVPAGVLSAAEAALRAALPAGCVHAPDGPGSVLVLARDADGTQLARALIRAVSGAASHHGAPLRAAAGVAEHPRDGDTPEGLLAHADAQLFAARAEGLPLA